MSDSDSDDENLIRYGTPLDPYEEDEVPSKRKFQQQPDQYAVDAYGKRRFHGAFTGGFSAGFGNTVGTPEGWTPSSFKSSRFEKARATNQKPEDFMDEEDRSEFGIAPHHMQTNQEFSGQKRKMQQRFHDGPIPGEPVLEHFVRTVHETAAVKMLRRMGWKEGQGVGDRVTRSEKKKKRDQHKVYGCYMPPDMKQESTQSSESSDSEFEYETLFAPDDYDPYILQKKSDRFGLGYKGLSRHSVLGNLDGGERSHLVMKEKGKKVSIRGQAFGVGAFEADDDDIYATHDMSHYDFALGTPTDQEKPKKSVEKGSNVIEGFVKATKPIPSVPSYPPPALPRDFTPIAAGSRRTRFEPTTAPQRDQGLGRHELTADARGALLGEVPLPKATDTQTDTQTNSQTVKQTEISKLLQKNIAFVSPNTEAVEKSSPDFISIKDSGKELVPKVFKPFASDPLKQSRYELYLRDKDSVTLERDREADRLSEWEKNREMVEFEQAAILYRPLSGAMGDRFTHASEPDEALNPLCAVAKSSVNYGLATPEQIEAAKIGAYGRMTRKETAWRPDAIVCKRFNIPELGGTRVEPKKGEKPNVSYSIFSYLESSVHDKESFTKEQSKFGGSKSLDFENKKDSSQNNNKETHNDVVNIERNKVSDVTVSKPTTSQMYDASNTNTSVLANKRMTVVDLFLKESVRDLQNKQQGVEVGETIEKFEKIDLYKAIFLSDSENENVDDEIDPANNIDNDFIVKPKNIERNTSPPRGIFANIDFDEINAWRRPDKNNGDTKSVENNNKTEVEKTEDKTENCINDTMKVENTEQMTINEQQNEIYGPKIPENLQKRLESEALSEEVVFRPIFTKKTNVEEESSSSDSWVEIKTKEKFKKEKKKKKKKHKSKHKKSKSKHKKNSN